MICRTLSLFILFIAFSFQASAQAFIVGDSARMDVHDDLFYWRDSKGTATIQEVVGQEMKTLRHSEAPNFGFDKATYWFRLEIKNKTQKEDWLLEVPFAPLDRVDFYESDSTGKWIVKSSGDHIPIRQREIDYRHPVFPVAVAKGETKTVYFKVNSNSSIQFPLTLWVPDKFVEASFHVQIINGLFYGAMLLMALYQLFLFFSIRDKITFFYVMALLSMTNVVAMFQGYSFWYVYPATPSYNDVMAMFAGPIFLLFSTLLTREFLSLKYFSGVLDKVLLANMTIDVVAGIAMYFSDNQISYRYHHYFVLIHCTLVLAAAGYCFYRDYKPARYYLLAWVSVLLATVIFTMSNLGFVPGYLSTNYSGLMIGCILQMLFISFALGDRWNQLLRETERAKELELKLREQEKVKLEHEVKVRTEEIQTKSERLEEVNRVKDKLFSLVSHDIKGPLGSLRLALTMMKTGQVSPEEFQHLTSALETRFGQTTEFVENLLQWATLQLKGEIFEPTTIDLSEIVNETVGLLELDIRKKEITIRNNVSQNFPAFADPNMVRSVLRNLMTNAVKFTGARGTIALNCWMNDQQVIISVADTGVGIPLANRNTLFTIESITTQGTKLEKGTGLGLMLCHEFIEKNGGKIWFDSEEGKGTTFFFSLPKEATCELPDTPVSAPIPSTASHG
ncbi:sensor histidine kinase [Pseudochryseolinea flava]|uniref:histidine kinase n=1 Tax=Pseudochryseolinea flava TaxID=2059302 RepID=A0A364Y8S1_9BACT|nr:sensor histidine kinase [Pseudochryseolinea flava]RAW02759.1 hypothetical protein DQQ10_01225 [Pseudochryseolinea flava]